MLRLKWIIQDGFISVSCILNFIPTAKTEPFPKEDHALLGGWRQDMNLFFCGSAFSHNT